MTLNRIDQLMDALSAIGIPFARDAWEEKAPEEYGVVILTAEQDALWADGMLVEESHAVDVWMYVKDGSDDGYETEVQAVLEAQDITYRLAGRDYLYDIDRVCWHWSGWLYGPLNEVVEDGES